MYAKRGNIESASKVFQRQRERDLVSWNSMISGYAQHGRAKKALEVFKEMQRQNMTMSMICQRIQTEQIVAILLPPVSPVP